MADQFERLFGVYEERFETTLGAAPATPRAIGYSSNKPGPCEKRDYPCRLVAEAF